MTSTARCLRFLLVILATSSLASAQDCESLIAEATVLYYEGEFEEVIGTVSPCTDTSEAYASATWLLVARTQYRRIKPDSVAFAVRKILEAEPDYQIDPAEVTPGFLRRFEAHRTQWIQQQQQPPAAPVGLQMDDLARITSVESRSDHVFDVSTSFVDSTLVISFATDRRAQLSFSRLLADGTSSPLIPLSGDAGIVESGSGKVATWHGVPEVLSGPELSRLQIYLDAQVIASRRRGWKYLLGGSIAVAAGTTLFCLTRGCTGDPGLAGPPRRP